MLIKLGISCSEKTKLSEKRTNWSADRSQVEETDCNAPAVAIKMSPEWASEW